MKHLVNNLLRTTNMVELLRAMGISLDNNTVSCKDERVIFTTKNIEQSEKLAFDLQGLLQKDVVKPQIRQVSIADLIADEIAQATSTNALMIETHKKSCLAVLNVLQMTGLNYTLDKEQEYLNIELPSAAYAPLFNSLNYKYMSIQNEEIKFNIKAFLNDHKQEIILVTGNSPLLFAHSDSFENKKVFYAEKKLSKDTTEVTPYFFVPDTLTPPTYHFVLDTSISMEGEPLAKLKKSVNEFADALFEFQPDAVINLTEFNINTKQVGRGSYRKTDLSQLVKDVNNLNAGGTTRLYGTVSDKLAQLLQSNQHNNVLLFTDGVNTVGNDDDETQSLNKTVTSIKQRSALIPVRNKFFILSYGVTQPEILRKVAETFSSPILYTDTIDFTEALSKKGKLQEWAAARELFTCRLEVTTNSQQNTRSEEYLRSYDMSGQFVALKASQFKNDEIMHLTITDGNGNTLLDDKKSIAKDKTMGNFVLPGSAKTASQLGVFALQEAHNKDASQTSTPTSTFQ
ncbi:VWA domain-containing protein [Legionella gresilensis]|uniref:VWA domain-containing protein n=1 Tax=Legionella gresilensis TaxID=91823 RepID=UPI00104168AB|nr:vWA domain-containing protein [Legionella gresilensis]